MGFELLAEVAWPPDAAAESPGQALAAAETLGWDAVWLAGAPLATDALGESHGIPASLHLLAAQLAALTARTRIGVSATLGPGFHPLHLAEEIALLDVLSGGRLDWAMGAPAGGDRSVFDEQLEIVERALGGERFSHAGRHFQIPELACLPRPVQAPPPLAVVARSGEEAAAAGRLGRALWIGPFERVEDVVRDVGVHREAARASGRTPGPPILVRLVYVADRDGDRDAVAPALDELARRSAGPAERGAGSVDACVVVGDATACVERIRELQARLEPVRIVAWTDPPGLPPRAAQASRERLARDVAPAVATAADG